MTFAYKWILFTKWGNQNGVRIKKSKPLKVSMEFVKDFYEINKENSKSNWKNLKLFPEFGYGCHHVNYDKCFSTTSLFSKYLSNRNFYTVEDCSSNGNEILCTEIIMTNFIKTNKNFHGSFATNNVECSVKYDKLMKG